MTKNVIAKSFSTYTWGGGKHTKPPPAVPEWPLNVPQVLMPAELVGEPVLGQGVAWDPHNPGTALWCLGGFDTTTFEPLPHNGLYRTTNFGSTWTRVGAVTGGYIDNPTRVRYDWDTPGRVYITSGVRGANQGLWISDDGGLTAERPAFLTSALSSASINTLDIYDIALDPNNPKHFLLSWHYPWEGSYGSNSGVVEVNLTTSSVTIHPPEPTWGTGHSIHFLCDPANSVGNSSTWLLGTQTNGGWRTSNAGSSWTQVRTQNIAHGGCQIHYDSTATWLYAAGENTLERSDDNGVTWEVAAASMACWAVFGDRIDSIFVKHNSGSSPLQKAAESSGTSFSNLTSDAFTGGIFEGCYDPATGLLLTSSWDSGPIGYRLRAV